MTYDIVIPSWNQISHVANCLNSILEFSKGEDYRIIFVDNNSENGVITEVQSLLTKHPPSLLIRNDQNLGFVKAINQGLKAADAPYIVLMNNDTLAVPGWLPKLRNSLFGVVGMVGPRTTAKGSWQGNWTRGTEGTLVLPSKAMLAFFCVMMTKELVEKVGYLDEKFGVGLGDDDDYCFRAHLAGFRLALVQDLIIPHLHRSTFKILYTEDQIKAMQVEAMRKFLDEVD